MPPDPKKDKQLIAAIDLLHGVTRAQNYTQGGAQGGTTPPAPAPAPAPAPKSDDPAKP